MLAMPVRLNTFIVAMNELPNESIVPQVRTCSCGSDYVPYWFNDGRGIPLFKGCPRCAKSKLKGYRSDIMDSYDADEPIDSED